MYLPSNCILAGGGLPSAHHPYKGFHAGGRKVKIGFLSSYHHNHHHLKIWLHQTIVVTQIGQFFFLRKLVEGSNNLVGGWGWGGLSLEVDEDDQMATMTNKNMMMIMMMMMTTMVMVSAVAGCGQALHYLPILAAPTHKGNGSFSSLS